MAKNTKKKFLAENQFAGLSRKYSLFFIVRVKNIHHDLCRWHGLLLIGMKINLKIGRQERQPHFPRISAYFLHII